jgi:hypothetical protein
MGHDALLRAAPPETLGAQPETVNRKNLRSLLEWPRQTAFRVVVLRDFSYGAAE